MNLDLFPFQTWTNVGSTEAAVSRSVPTISGRLNVAATKSSLSYTPTADPVKVSKPYCTVFNGSTSFGFDHPNMPISLLQWQNHAV